MQLLVLYGLAEGFAAWWKITEKVSFVATVLNQASQMPSSKEPHLAREP